MFILISMFVISLHGISKTSIDSEEILSQVLSKGEPLEILFPPKAQKRNKPVEVPFSGFIKNQGQINNEEIRYYYSMNGISIGFSCSKIDFVTNSESFSITFPDANKINPKGIQEQKNYINFFYPNLHLVNVPTYQEIWYYDLYDKIDLRYYMSEDGLKYEFVVHPGADPNEIILEASNTVKLELDYDNMVFTSRDRNKPLIQDSSLRVFQTDGIEIPARFLVQETSRYGFYLEAYDSSQTVTIDPLILSYSTFLGGNDLEIAYNLAIDNDNNTYICGSTSSTNFPSFNEYDNTLNGSSDAFITKLNSTGTGIVFSTYLGGTSYETARGLVVDEESNIYLSGTTNSNNFPTYKGLNNSHNGGEDGFITKLNSTGNELIFSTYIGGSSNENTIIISVDSSSNIYIGGTTYSANFPKVNAFDDVIAGGSEAFVAKLNATGSGLLFSSYLGGDGQDYIRDMAIDDYNHIYLTGDTYSSTNFPLVNAINDTLSGPKDYFVSKVNAAGDGLIFSTYLGGNNYDNPTALAVDVYNQTYICGTTTSDDYPVVNAYDSIFDGAEGFITKLNATGTGFVFSTFFGGSASDIPEDISVDVYNNTFVGGTTRSSNLPVMNAYDASNNGGLNNKDAFMAKFNSTGTGLLFSTYLGGSEDEEARTITVDTYNNSYISGFTESPDFPTYRAFNSTHSGAFDSDVFVTKLTIDEIAPTITLASHQNNSIYPSGIVLNIAVADEYLDTVWYNWDNSPNQTWNSPYQTPLPSGEGTHWLYVYANDTAGHLVTETYSFITDDIDPIITLETPMNNTIHNSGTLIDLSVTEIHLDVLRYYWDIGTYQILEPPYQTPLPSGEGVHTLYLLAIDSAGNGKTMVFTFITDDSNPIVEISHPTTTTYSVDSVTLTYTVSEGTTSVYINGVVNSTAITSGSIIANLPEGENNITIVAVDTAGNTGHTTIVFIIDTFVTTTIPETTTDDETTTTSKGGYFPGFIIITFALISIKGVIGRRRKNN